MKVGEKERSRERRMEKGKERKRKRERELFIACVMYSCSNHSAFCVLQVMIIFSRLRVSSQYGF